MREIDQNMVGRPSSACMKTQPTVRHIKSSGTSAIAADQDC
jgi:hypothetical protein